MTRPRRLIALLIVLAIQGFGALPSIVGAQTPTSALSGLLNNGCAGLGPGPFDSSLDGICVSSGVGTVGGWNISSLISRETGGGFDRQVHDRLDESRTFRRLPQLTRVTDLAGTRAASADAQFGPWQVWASGTFERQKHYRTEFDAAHDVDENGLSVGGDYRLGPNLLVGAALSYSRADTEFNVGGQIKTLRGAGLLYASFEPIPSAFVDATAGYTYRDYEIRRRNTYNGVPFQVDSFAVGTTQGNEASVSGRAGYDFIIRNVTVGPRFGVAYKALAVDAFSERGVQRFSNRLDTGLELTYDNQDRDSLMMNVGAYLAAAFSTSLGVFVPQLTVEYVHEFLDDQRVIYFSFVEDAARQRFRFQTAPPTRDFGNIAGGLMFVARNGISAFVNYRALVGDEDRTSHNVTAGLRFAF